MLSERTCSEGPTSQQACQVLPSGDQLHGAGLPNEEIQGDGELSANSVLCL